MKLEGRDIPLASSTFSIAYRGYVSFLGRHRHRVHGGSQHGGAHRDDPRRERVHLGHRLPHPLLHLDRGGEL